MIARAKLVIRGPDSMLIMAGGVWLIDISMHGMELRAAWEGITYAKLVLCANHLIMEGDSAVVVGWLRDILTIVLLLTPLFKILVILWWKVYSLISDIFIGRQSVADWMASFVAQHLDKGI